jgi:hypothetical protein
MRVSELDVGKAWSRAELNQPPLKRRGNLSEALRALLRVLAAELKLAIDEQNFDSSPRYLNLKG